MQKGFSLIEFLIVIAVMTVIASAVGFNLFGFFSKKNIENDVKKIVFSLRSAREKSIEQENLSQWGVHFENSIANSDFLVIFSGGSYVSSTVASRTPLSSGMEFINPAQGSSTDIIFSKIYGLPSTTSSIMIGLAADNSVSSTIVISSQGQIGY